MSSNGKKRERVRFAEGTVEHTRKALPGEEPLVSSSLRRPKRPRPERPNEDEIDDIDDYIAKDDEEEGLPKDIPSEHELLEAKRERRMRQRDAADQDGDTKIDNRTSLAAEGIQIEPFSMEQEKSDGTGYFDGDTYVFRKRDGDEEPDAWLESLSELKEDYAVASKEQDEPENDMDNWMEEELYAKILPLVSDTETVMQAIARYGNLLKRPHSKQQSNKDHASSESSNMAQTALNELTEAANALLLKGRVDIYQQTRNDLLKLLPNENTVSAYKDDDKPKVQWEYQGSQDGQVHGPYTTQQMQGWIQQGYFVGPTAVKVRTISEEKTQKKSMQEDLLSDLMDDDDENGKDKTEQVHGDWMQSDQVDFSKYS